MQSASSNFVRAVTGAGGVWAESQLEVDWTGAGYQGDDSIDNLTRQLGDWTVTHHLDDGYPDQVTFISGIGVGTLDAELGAPPAYLTDNLPMKAAEYFSPFNPASPVYGFERDIPPVTIEAGLVTDGGPERVRIFTGQMTDIPIRRGEASLKALSATRLKLKALVQPPAAYGLYQGANATWPITYALHSCGVYPSPPPQTGCRFWLPLHGSVRAFLPAVNGSVLNSFAYVGGVTGPTRVNPIRWVDGPFVAAGGFSYIDADSRQEMVALEQGTDTFLAPGEELITSTGKGKVELWVKGVDTDLNAVPGASGVSASSWFRFIALGTSGNNLDLGIRSDNRKLYISWSDGTNGGNFISTMAVPADDEWHFVGFAWDFATEHRWMNIDGVIEVSTSSVINPLLMPATEVFAASRPYVAINGLPTAEIQITGGYTPDNHAGWLNELEGVTWTRTATVTRSLIELTSIAEKEPREAWELIGSYAQVELASMRTDETDVFQYLGLSHWAQDAQQAIVDRISTDENAGAIDVNIDPTKIRNAVVVNFSESYNMDLFGLVFSSQDTQELRPGVTTIIVALDPAATEIRGFTFANVAAADTVEPTDTNTVSINATATGTGDYATTDQVSAVVASWNPGSATITVTNVTLTTYYLANNKNWPTMTIAAKALQGRSASVTESSAASIALRGERSITVAAPALHSRYDARRLAQRIRSALSDPVPVADEIPVMGDPRRQPGDLVTVEDPTVTRASGLWRVQSITHESRGPNYVQRLRVRPAFSVGIVGISRVGQCIVGPRR